MLFLRSAVAGLLRHKRRHPVVLTRAIRWELNDKARQRAVALRAQKDAAAGSPSAAGNAAAVWPGCSKEFLYFRFVVRRSLSQLRELAVFTKFD